MVDNVYKRAVASLNPSFTEFPFYFPESVYESIPHSGAPPSPSSETDAAKIATDFISKRLNLGADDFKVVDSYTDFDQHLTKRDITVSAPEATVDFAKASATASAQLGIPVDSEFEHVLEYVAQPGGKIVYAYSSSCATTHDQVGRDTVYLIVSSIAKNGQPLLQMLRAAAVNLFYVANVMHDITYQYGFTEQAGNFQKSNFGKGGKEGDQVIIKVLDPSGVDNSEFFAPLTDDQE
ncbi:hypothetical protein BASA83_010478 [Batrachochytrium salamandrivorans]|nr:hypothetical protein BASA83_010478 [Batrachochytrium salamandrivorans]